MSRTVDYGGHEVTKALPSRLEELRPGLPRLGIGGSVDALSLVGDDVREWLADCARVGAPS